VEEPQEFVSPHTGLVYQKHITGLCQFMQDEVELEVRRAQAFGKLHARISGSRFHFCLGFPNRTEHVLFRP